MDEFIAWAERELPALTEAQPAEASDVGRLYKFTVDVPDDGDYTGAKEKLALAAVGTLRAIGAGRESKLRITAKPQDVNPGEKPSHVEIAMVVVQ
jgi:hypothetical protein